MTLSPDWPVLQQRVLWCFGNFFLNANVLHPEPPGESRYGFRHGIRRSKLVRNPSPYQLRCSQWSRWLVSWSCFEKKGGKVSASEEYLEYLEYLVIESDWLVLHFEVRLAGGQQLRRGPGVPTQWRLSGRNQWYTQLQCRDLATEIQGIRMHSIRIMRINMVAGFDYAVWIG